MNKEEWKEKQERKLERYKELAEKSSKESTSAYEGSRKIASYIPFGQPILVGHHSEGRHRRDINRIDSLMKKSVELSEKSDYYAAKVENLLNPTAISSDDPEAVLKLKNKLEGLYKERENIKARTHQSWELSNLSGNITTVKKRIAHLEALQKIPEIAPVEKDGIKIVVNKDINRVQILYPGKPSEDVRSQLKSNGFRWSPYEGAWQRQISNYAYHEAKRIVGVEE